MANYWLFIKYRIPNVIFSEPPMPRWKMWTIKVAAGMLAIVVPDVIFILTKRFGDFNVFWVSILCLVLAIFAAI
jgi:hypothetical protein